MTNDNKTKSSWGEKQTQFFYDLTPELIFKSVEQFGVRCTGRCLALNSMENRVYEIELEPEGSAYPELNAVVAKFYRPGRWSKEQILEEHAYLERLVDVEIPVIQPLKSESEGKTLLQTEESSIFFAVFPKLGGRSPDELSDEDCEIVGRLIGRMHNVGASLNAKHRMQLTPQTYGLNYLDFFENSTVIPENLKDAFLSIVKTTAELVKPMFESVEHQAIHGDAHLGNLLHGREGFFWVDFDDMVVGPPVQDIWLTLPGRDHYAKEKLQCILSGYEVMRPFDRRSLALIEPLRALRMIHFAAWIGIRWQDPAFPRAFPFYSTPEYWRNLVTDLQMQIQFIQGFDQEFSWL